MRDLHVYSLRQTHTHTHTHTHTLSLSLLISLSLSLSLSLPKSVHLYLIHASSPPPNSTVESQDRLPRPAWNLNRGTRPRQEAAVFLRDHCGDTRESWSGDWSASTGPHHRLRRAVRIMIPCVCCSCCVYTAPDHNLIIGVICTPTMPNGYSRVQLSVKDFICFQFIQPSATWCSI